MVRNATDTGNLNSSSIGYGGGGIYVCFYYNTTNADFYNNIIWGNTAASGLGQDVYLEDHDINYGGGAAINFHYNDFSELDYDDGSGLTINNNIDQDPIFVNDFLLSASSPCIDEGSDGAPMLPENDFAGELRDALPDMGADEFVPENIYIICIGTSDDLCNDQAINVSEALTYTIEDTDLNYIRIHDIDIIDGDLTLSEKVQLGIESGSLTIF